MFILVSALTRSGFFRWIGLHALRAAKNRPIRLFFIFAGLAALLSAFMDSITVLIFMAPLSLEVCRRLRVSPVPFLVAQITSANIGGASTMVGDPPNVVLGTALNLTFFDFLVNTGPIALVLFFVNAGAMYLWFRRAPPTEPEPAAVEGGDPFAQVEDVRLMRLSLAVFAFTVTLLALHHVLDLLVAFVALLGATLVLILGGRDMPDLVEKIDWHTLLFLAGLFVLVGGLRKTGVLDGVTSIITDTVGANPILLITLLLWVSALASAIVDNVPFAAAMAAILGDLSQATGVPVTTLAWTVALGSDVGGNATPIGASANVVGLAVAEKHGVHVRWRTYVGHALPPTVVCLAVANLLLVLRYGL